MMVDAATGGSIVFSSGFAPQGIIPCFLRVKWGLTIEFEFYILIEVVRDWMIYTIGSKFKLRHGVN